MTITNQRYLQSMSSKRLPGKKEVLYIMVAECDVNPTTDVGRVALFVKTIDAIYDASWQTMSPNSGTLPFIITILCNGNDNRIEELCNQIINMLPRDWQSMKIS
jgi:hypothetical protein